MAPADTMQDSMDLEKIATAQSCDKKLGGTTRLRNVITNEVLLIPQPSDDPADPLRWSKLFKAYVAVLVCSAQFFGNFILGGPAIAIVQQALDFGDHNPKTLLYWIGQAAYFTTTSTLLAGVGNFIWVPTTVKYGRRPVYVSSLILVCAASIWCGCAKSYGAELAGRIILGFGVGAAESVAPLTISDIFFLHERGFWMSLYFCALASGVSTGVALSGLIVINLPWPYIYWITLALNGTIMLLVIGTFPETSFARSYEDPTVSTENKTYTKAKDHLQASAKIEQVEVEQPKKPLSPLKDLRVFHHKATNESLAIIASRPIVLLVLPPVLWGTAVLAINVGGVIVLTTTVATAFGEAYGFQPWQSGLTFLAGVIGCLIGLPVSGWLSDKVANYLTVRNNGIREAEMRLPALMVATITGVLSLMLYGAGIAHRWHWIVPTIGIGLQNFALVCASNVAMLYMIESFRPISGEVVVTGMAYKAGLAFLLSFYVNPWIFRDGYVNVMGTIAGILAAVQMLSVPLYFWGKALRRVTTTWRVMRVVGWAEDREVGE